MKWLIVVHFLAGGVAHDDVIPLGVEVTTLRQCQAQAQPVLAMWAGAQPGGIEIRRFSCVEDDGRGRA